MGHLIRAAVEAQYGVIGPADRLAAVRALGALSLPIDTVAEMKLQSVPRAEDEVP